MMRGEWFYIFEFRNVKLSEFFPNILTQAKGLLGKNFLSYAIHLLRSFVHSFVRSHSSGTLKSFYYYYYN